MPLGLHLRRRPPATRTMQLPAACLTRRPSRVCISVSLPLEVLDQIDRQRNEQLLGDETSASFFHGFWKDNFFFFGGGSTVLTYVL